MLHHLKGELIDINPARAILECSGVGYLVNITLTTYAELSKAGKHALLYIHPIYKEDSQTLFGFFTQDEREVFTLLISVSGVGGNTGRVILSSLSAEEVRQCIASENVNLLKSIKGIGAKTAERIIVDLKDKVLRQAPISGELGATSVGNLSREAVNALEVLGYAPKSTEKLVARLAAANPQYGLEELIKQALKQL